MSEDLQQFTLGVHVKIEGHYWLPVRFVKSSTLHEEPASGTVFIEDEEYWELRNKHKEAKFFSISSQKFISKRDAGPCRGIKPYFWKENQKLKEEEEEEVNAEGI